MSHQDADPFQRFFNEGCYFGRHLLAQVVGDHARERVKSRRQSHGDLRHAVHFAADRAFAAAYSDHMLETEKVFPRIPKR